MKKSSAILLGLCLIIVLFMAAHRDDLQSRSINNQQEVKTMKVTETVNALRAAGLAIEPEAVQKAFDGEFQAQSPLDILMQLALGEYDEEEEKMVPYTRAAYAFEGEIMVVSTMYTDFLRGVERIVPGAAFTDIREDLSGVTPDVDETSMIPTDGRRAFSFCLNGHPYALELDSHCDGFNGEAIGFVNEVLKKENFEGRLCHLDVMSIEGFLLFYGTEETIQKVLAVLGVREGQMIF